ncbi:PMP inhibitor motif protein [Ranid herpesvirus 3]|uniref:PMP inhibitor motif protein n=1 Tax=Ranid herpesvirus 3 TaxID=1987509 RepID=A0A1X9T539_9VIRU|nr:PMP inhibitor motif protein [Ranid herpesvirus 3]ARR28813.1 PMP inhibitor motif protein [Ranid herpesvirus 3]
MQQRNGSSPLVFLRPTNYLKRFLMDLIVNKFCKIYGHVRAWCFNPWGCTLMHSTVTHWSITRIKARFLKSLPLAPKVSSTGRCQQTICRTTLNNPMTQNGLN